MHADGPSHCMLMALLSGRMHADGPSHGMLMGPVLSMIVGLPRDPPEDSSMTCVVRCGTTAPSPSSSLSMRMRMPSRRLHRLAGAAR
jgi:hypothetical protein